MTGCVYKYEEYSLFDICDFLEKKGFEVKFCEKGTIDEHHKVWREENNLPPTHIRKHGKDVFQVIDTDVYIDIPRLDTNFKVIIAQINFYNHPKTKYYEQSKKDI